MPDPRLDESACELISYSEQVIVGDMRDMRDIAAGIPCQDDLHQIQMPPQPPHSNPMTQNVVFHHHHG